MPEQTPELGPAVNQLITAVRKGGANILLWAVMTAVAAAPVAVQQINAQRAPNGGSYLNPADFEILGPERAEPGTLVRLTVVDYLPTDTCWFTVGDSQKYGCCGAELVFAMPGGPTIVTCAIIRHGKLYLTHKTIENAVAEPSEPEPTPDPEPVQPEIEPLSGIGEKALKMAADGNLAKSDALALAKNLREAVEKAATNPRNLVMFTSELNEGLDLPDEVAQGIKVLLQTLAENSEMVGIRQHVDVWNQMADGFEAYASE